MASASEAISSIAAARLSAVACLLLGGRSSLGCRAARFLSRGRDLLGAANRLFHRQQDRVRARKDLLAARSDLINVPFHDTDARQDAGRLLIFGLGRRNDLFELPTHHTNLIADGSHDVLDASGILPAVPRQIPDILGDDRKSFAEIARACGLDRSADRQHIGLDGDHRDAVDDLVDPAADLLEVGDQLDARPCRFQGVRDARRQIVDRQANFGEHRTAALGTFEG